MRARRPNFTAPFALGHDSVSSACSPLDFTVPPTFPTGATIDVYLEVSGFHGDNQLCVEIDDVEVHQVE